MPRYTTKLIARAEIAGGTMAFTLERPAGFSMTTGAVTEPPADEGIACYKVRVSDDVIEVES